MIPWLSGLIGVYALTAIGGGIAGYVSAKSNASLYAGVGSGLLLLVGLAVVMKKPSIGYAITALGCLALIGGMLPRFLKGGAIWPAGVIAFGGIIVLIAHIVAHFMPRR